MESVTVLVVGAGPTGLLLAAELRRRGVDCMLIDAHDRAPGWDRATVVHPRSLEILEHIGIVGTLLNAGVRQHRAHISAGGKTLGTIDLALSGSRYPYNIGISEEVTEAILAGYLASQNGSVTRGTRLVGLEQDANGARATIEHKGLRRTVGTAWVVGCDGHDSTVRTLAGIEQDGQDIVEPWAVFDASVPGWTSGFDGNFAYLDDVPVVLTSLPAKRWRIYLRPRGGDSDLVADALSTLQRYMPDARFEGVANPARFQCHSKVARSYRAGRILLAGDAAHTCSPAQGHGMNSGLQDAWNLGWKLALVCRGTCPDCLLDSYEAERRPVAQRVVKSGADADSGQLIADPQERMKRDATIRDMLADPARRHQEAVAEAELDIDYAGSPIVAGEPHEALWPGQRLPDQVALEGAGSRWRMLHDLVRRQGHTALLVGGPEASGAELAAARRALAIDGAIVERAFTVTSNPGVPADARLDAATAQRLGITDIVLLVVRPDGHVGLRAGRDHAAALGDYCALLRGS